MVLFVNPYTFVPFVEPDRGKPAGHLQLDADRFSGAFALTISTNTEMLLGPCVLDAQGQATDIPRLPDGTAVIPGSSVAGAVRSLHEALAGGCLRVLDPDYVPVHRHPPNSNLVRDLQLAVVLAPGSRDVTPTLAMCDDVVWIDTRWIAGMGGGQCRTGDRVRVPLHLVQLDGHGRRALMGDPPPEGQGVTPAGPMSTADDGSYVLLISDFRARDPRQHPTAYVTAGRVTANVVTVDDPGVWSTFLAAVDDADDLRPQASVELDVRWPPGFGGLVGQRLPARRELHPGEPVWVTVTGGAVSEVRLAQWWRSPRGEPLGRRVGATRVDGKWVGGAAPCYDPTELCWSCRVFGSVDEYGADADEASRQRSYRGHVRFADAAAAAAVTPASRPLAPLREPKPTAGQFYLDNTAIARAGATLAPVRDWPIATWGSAGDHPTTRPIRGRKFYWRTTPVPGGRQRGDRRPEASNATDPPSWLIPPGSTFTTRVGFENLSAADVGSLAAALDPRRAFPGHPVVQSIGGGKPFGFGAVDVDVELAELGTAASRYLGVTAPTVALAEFDAAFQQQVPAAVRATWTALQHALTVDYVDRAAVWYPPGDGVKGSKEFDQSFTYFGRTSGRQTRNARQPLVSLPDAVDAPDAQKRDSAG